jgi:cellulose synthase/poly-beta-1,6-N-acetylglucosamine synthase-like glycosyltransferase
MIQDIIPWLVVVLSAVASVEAARAAMMLAWNLSHEPQLEVAPLAEPAVAPHVTVVIPAKDEETWIETSARAVLASTYPSLDLILVNDRSRDRTGEIMRRIAADDPRVTVLTVTETPPGWTGKTNALFKAAEKARGDLLLFTDADSVLSPETLGRCVGFLIGERIDIVSLLPGFIARGFGEYTTLPHLILGLLYLNPLNQVNREGRAACLAAGCFLLMSRNTYRALGAWERFRAELTEDIALTVAAKRAGMRVFLLPGDELIRTRPMRNILELIECWTRILYGACEKRAGKLLRLLGTYCGILAMIGLNMYALFSVLLGPFRLETTLLFTVTGIGVTSLAVPVTKFFSKHAGGARYAAASPLGILLSAWIAARALAAVLLRTGVKWRDAVYR